MSNKRYCGLCNIIYKYDGKKNIACPVCKNNKNDYSLGYYVSSKFKAEYPCKDNMIWMKNYYNQLNVICRLPNIFPDDSKLKMQVISIHKSKSIELPVIKLNYRKMVVIFNNNFSDIEVYIKSPIQIESKWIDDLIINKEDDFYYAGMPDFTKKAQCYGDNIKEFYCRTRDIEMLLYIITRLVSRKWI